MGCCRGAGQETEGADGKAGLPRGRQPTEHPELATKLLLLRQVADLAALHRKVIAEFRLVRRHILPLVVETDDGVGRSGHLFGRRSWETLVEDREHFFSVDHNLMKTGGGWAGNEAGAAVRPERMRAPIRIHPRPTGDTDERFHLIARAMPCDRKGKTA